MNKTRETSFDKSTFNASTIPITPTPSTPSLTVPSSFGKKIFTASQVQSITLRGRFLPPLLYPLLLVLSLVLPTQTELVPFTSNSQYAPITSDPNFVGFGTLLHTNGKVDWTGVDFRRDCADGECANLPDVDIFVLTLPVPLECYNKVCDITGERRGRVGRGRTVRGTKPNTHDLLTFHSSLRSSPLRIRNVHRPLLPL